MELPPSAALYCSTPTTHHDQTQDVLNFCILNGYIFAHLHKYNGWLWNRKKWMAEEQTKAFNELQTDFIGPEEEATLNPPTWDENGVKGENMVWKNWHSWD